MNNQLIGKEIYLMPFTPKSILTYHLLKDNGFSVIGFCDNSSSLESEKFDSIPIYTPDKAYKNKPTAVILLSELNYTQINKSQMCKLGFNEIFRIDELSFQNDLTDYMARLNSDLYSKLIPNQELYGKCMTMNLPLLKTWQELMEELKNEYIEPYKISEDETLKFQPNDLKISFLICINATGYFNKNFFKQCLCSLSDQTYKIYSLLIISSPENTEFVQQGLKEKSFPEYNILSVKDDIMNIELIGYSRKNYKDYNKYDSIITVGANDTLSKNALLNFAEAISLNSTKIIFTANEDRLYNDDYISPFYKPDYITNSQLSVPNLLKNAICVKTTYNGSISDININDIHIINKVLYHYRIHNNHNNDNEIKVIAFYLPQFHAIAENDEWWGKGFTEWTNVKRAKPMFAGHYQPRFPGELGYYDLIKDRNIQKKQMELAQEYGVYGFCYYYYWFNGKRLLEKPLNNVLRDPSLDMPFCICWANENWTRRWDGKESEVLMSQAHNEDSDKRFILETLPILKDPRYITVNGAPVLLIYRYDMFDDFKTTVKKWKEIASENGLKDIHVSVMKTSWYPHRKIKDMGCSSETEFPPWRTLTPQLYRTQKELNSDFAGSIYDYEYYIKQSMNMRKKENLSFRGMMLGFDNTPRKMENASIYHGATPDSYKKLLMSLVDFTVKRPKEERLIFVNAWNEWAESNYLEPDSKYARAYLESTLEAIGANY